MTVLPCDDFGQRIQALRPGTAQTVQVGAVSTASAAFGAATTVVRIVATTPCFFALGASPLATPASHYLCPELPEYFRVEPGERLGVLSAGTGGALHISEMA